jgi:hypothetical protein
LSPTDQEMKLLSKVSLFLTSSPYSISPDSQDVLMNFCLGGGGGFRCSGSIRSPRKISSWRKPARKSSSSVTTISSAFAPSTRILTALPTSSRLTYTSLCLGRARYRWV